MTAPNFGNLPENCHTRIRAVADYWASIHPATGLPGRRHFDPADIPDLLPDLRLVEVQGPPMRFRIRLMGTNLVAAFGQDHTGRYYDEVSEGFDQTPLFANFRDIVESREPNWRRGDHRLNPMRDYILMERVILPLAEDGENVNVLLMLMHFESRFGVEGEDAQG